MLLLDGLAPSPPTPAVHHEDRPVGLEMHFCYVVGNASLCLCKWTQAGVRECTCASGCCAIHKLFYQKLRNLVRGRLAGFEAVSDLKLFFLLLFK